MKTILSRSDPLHPVPALVSRFRNPLNNGTIRSGSKKNLQGALPKSQAFGQDEKYLATSRLLGTVLIFGVLDLGRLCSGGPDGNFRIGDNTSTAGTSMRCIQ
jgi:hypothetical protein